MGLYLQSIFELQRGIKVKRIILHWTGGMGTPNLTDTEHYHYLVDIGGRLYPGKFPVEANEVCKNDKYNHALYAAHTGGGNTGSIGVAMCGMVQFKNKNDVGKCPLTRIQVETAMQLCAELCKKYNIPITKTTVLTHYEFGKAHPQTRSAGKIDIVYLPPFSYLPPEDIGNFIRNKVTWYLTHPENRKTLLN